MTCGCVGPVAITVLHWVQRRQHRPFILDDVRASIGSLLGALIVSVVVVAVAVAVAATVELQSVATGLSQVIRSRDSPLPFPPEPLFDVSGSHPDMVANNLTPLSDTLCPKKVTSLLEKTHRLLCKVILAFSNLFITSSNFFSCLYWFFS